jgi:hypothetical protein
MTFLSGLISTLFGRWRDSVLGGVEMKAAALYATGVRKARGAFIALLLAILFLLLLMSGFLLIHVALFLWLPWSLKARALALLLLGVVYFIGGLAVVVSISSERAWMRYTGVDRLLARLPVRQ